MYTEIDGDLIKLAQAGNFKVIAHGANCFCSMKSGIAPQMAKAFGCDQERGLFKWEQPEHRGDISKLGCIEYYPMNIGPAKTVIVVNAYTQYRYGRLNHADGDEKPLDYEALTLCMRKMNHTFKGLKIGLPRIGAGLGGGDWERIKEIIQTEFKDCDVVVVNYKP